MNVLDGYIMVLLIEAKNNNEKHQKRSGGNLMKETTHLLMNFDLREV